MVIGIRDKNNVTTQINDITIELHQGNIAMLGTDAIVNAAHENLLMDSGVGAVILEKGGETIQKECNEIGHCEVGSAVMTSGGDLIAKHVIHAVGTLFGASDEHNLLRSAIQSALNLAEKHNLASIALPAMCADTSHFPPEDCAEIMLTEIKRFASSGKLKSIKYIVVCLQTKKDFAVFEKVLYATFNTNKTTGFLPSRSAFAAY